VAVALFGCARIIGYLDITPEIGFCPDCRPYVQNGEFAEDQCNSLSVLHLRITCLF
jgi:hypothetical protein